MRKRQPRIEDLLEFNIPASVQLAPSGDWAVWSERYVDSVDSGHGKVHAILKRGAVGHPVEILTQGAVFDASPRISPSGSLVAFVRTPVDSTGKPPAAELCVVPAAGGAARVLVREHGAFGPPAWSPDGRQLVVAFRRADDHGDHGDGPLAIRVTRLHYKEDGSGYLPRDRFHLYLVSVDDAEPVLTPVVDADSFWPDAGWDDVSPSWSPDGKRIAFLSNRRDSRDLDVENQDVFVISAEGGEAVQCTVQRGPVFGLAWAPDGTWLAVTASPGPLGYPLTEGNAHLFRVSPTGSHAEIDLTPGFDRCVINLTIDDIWGLETMSSAPAFSADGRAIYVPVSDQGTTWLGALELDPDGQARGVLTPVIRAASVVYYSAAAGRLATITTAPDAPGRIERWTLAAGTATPELISWPMQRYCDSVELAQPIELWVPGEAGEAHGWLLMPPGDGPHPLLLSIHGGPTVQYGHVFMHEPQTFVARGYAVLYANPRGSQGYGSEHARATYRNWATPAYEDLMAVLDHVLARYPIAAERLGVLGGSYGGYLTNWIVAHTHRFKAACSQRTISSLEALIWSDYGATFGLELGASCWDEPELYQRLSPITYVRNIETPMLITQGLSDQRTCADQGERLYVALRSLGKPAEMVLFPGASHDLSRCGPPRQRIERLRVIHEWFERYLLPSG